MRHRRWADYLLIGALFGILDWVFLQFLAGFPWQQTFGSIPGGQFIGLALLLGMDLGIWLVPVVPIAVYETRRSGSKLCVAAGSLLTWAAAIVSYYATYAALLAFWGLPHMEHLLFSNAGSEGFWQNWQEAFRRLILAGILEYMVLAVVGGAVVGLLTRSLYLRFARLPVPTA